MKLNKTFALALLLSLAGLFVWEMHSRNKGYVAALNDDKALWAVERSKVDNLGPDDIVILGSSRAHFDLQLDEWESITGRRPIMLASDGSSPTPVILDIVNNSSFNGTLVIGVTPGLFFSPPVNQAPMWHRPQTRVDHFHDRTWAQRLNHYLSLPLERTFAFLNSSEEEWADDIDLKSMISRIRIGERMGPPMPPFYNFSYVDKYRNTFMLDKTVTDTAFAATIQRVWMFFLTDAPPPVKDTILNMYFELGNRFKERGGKIIFARLPSSHGFRDIELENVPRENFWEVLLDTTGSPGYHFEDYPELNKYVLPEWSHLNTPDAKDFTIDFVNLLLEDAVIKKQL